LSSTKTPTPHSGAGVLSCLRPKTSYLSAPQAPQAFLAPHAPQAPQAAAFLAPHAPHAPQAPQADAFLAPHAPQAPHALASFLTPHAVQPAIEADGAATASEPLIIMRASAFCDLFIGKTNYSLGSYHRFIIELTHLSLFE